MSGFDSYSTAARFRDIMRRTAQSQAAIIAPQASVGRVVSIDIERLKAMVWFPGDETPIQVNIFATAIPGDWQARHQNDGTEETSISGHGSLVVVERFKGQQYVTQVLTGGSFSFGSNVMNQYVVTQLPQVGDAASTELSGNEFELYTAAEVIGAVDDGGAIAFGPFRSSHQDETFVGAIDMTVQIGDQAVKQYRFASSPKNDVKAWDNNAFGVMPHWYRILPEREVTSREQDEHVDFDLEIGFFQNYYMDMPSGSRYATSRNFHNPHYTLWFRIVKRGSWGDIAAKVSIRTTSFQLTIADTGIFGNETFSAPVRTAGWLGFDGHTVHGFENRLQVAWQDDFLFDATNTWEVISGEQPWYKWDSNGFNYTPTSGQESAFSVASREGRITMAATNTEYTIKRLDVYGEGAVAKSGVMFAAQVSTGAAIISRTKMYFDDNLTDTQTDDQWIGFQIDWGLSGTATPRISKKVAGTITNIAAGSTFSYTAGQKFNYLISCSLGIYRFKVWEAGSPEPADFTIVFENTGTAPNPTFAHFAFTGQRNTGNTNSNAVVGWMSLKSYQGVNSTFPTRDGIKWRPGPWRSGLLRAATDLQRALTHTGYFQFDGTFLSWTGEILLTGIGRNRNGLPSGTIRIRPPAKYPGFVDEATGSGDPVYVYPQGTQRYGASSGIRLEPGEALYAAIPPGMPDIDLSGYYLFIVDSNDSTRDYELPEWAVLIASRSNDSSAPLRFGTGFVGHSHQPMHGENGAFLATFASAVSATFAITFDTPFRTAPQVSTNIDSGSGSTARWGSRGINATTTGFTFFLFQNQAIASAWTDIKCSWTATEHGF